MDMRVAVSALPPELATQAQASESSAQIRLRCQAAHERALRRQGVSNHALSPPQLLALPISDAAQVHLTRSAAQHGWSARLVHRSLRLAQTIADLAQADQIDHSHMLQALHFRSPWQEKG
jgi:magnesium chelatase family protein